MDTTKNIADMESFRAEVEQLVNRLSLEKYSDTPDFVIAQYLTECFIAYNRAHYAMRLRENGEAYEKPPITHI